MGEPLAAPSGPRFPGWVQPLLLVSALLVLYGWSAPRTVALEDDGLFLLAAYFNGVTHPPAYLLYTLLAHLITYLPLGSVAWRVHLLSGMFGALWQMG